MIQTVNLSEFRSAFHNMGRGEQFSYEALELIFDYYEHLELDCGTPTELDVIAICCDIKEMTAEEVRDNYGLDSCDDDTDGDCDDVREYLDNNTSVIGQTDDKIIFFQF